MKGITSLDPELTHHGTCLPLAHLGHLSHDWETQSALRSAQPSTHVALDTPSSPVAQGLGQVVIRHSKRLHPSGNSLSRVRGIKGVGMSLWVCARGSVCLGVLGRPSGRLSPGLHAAADGAVHL